MGLLFVPKSKEKIIEIYDNTPGKKKNAFNEIFKYNSQKSEKIQCIKYKIIGTNLMILMITIIILKILKLINLFKDIVILVD